MVLKNKIHKLLIFVDFKKLKDAIAVHNEPVYTNFSDKAFHAIFRMQQALLFHDFYRYRVLVCSIATHNSTCRDLWIAS
jgi:hypothetical protein